MHFKNVPGILPSQGHLGFVHSKRIRKTKSEGPRLTWCLSEVSFSSQRSGARGWVSGEGKQVRDGGQASQAVASVLSEAGTPQSWGQLGDSDQAHLCRQLH